MAGDTAPDLAWPRGEEALAHLRVARMAPQELGPGIEQMLGRRQVRPQGGLDRLVDGTHGRGRRHPLDRDVDAATVLPGAFGEGRLLHGPHLHVRVRAGRGHQRRGQSTLQVGGVAVRADDHGTEVDAAARDNGIDANRIGHQRFPRHDAVQGIAGADLARTGRATGACYGAGMGQRRWSGHTIVWIFAISVVLFAQWPMLKGRWYQWTGAAPPASAIVWHTEIETALAEARRLDRPVLVDFMADWCPPCVTMTHDVWPNAAIVAAVQEGYVPLQIDIDRHPDVAQRYEVYGIPSVIVVDGAGRVVRRASFMSAGGMERFLAGQD
ncbi:thioredoxin family protein [Luteitalea sp.]|uniref:thioredoxin family protein n=1 Tax=Luteitalea sp. TaxID=2004800 RepID=UPI0025BA516E|nr:thioredoxin family protein [Luteitalea sp.]